MQGNRVSDGPRYRAYGRSHLDRLEQLDGLLVDQKVALTAVSAVFPFKVNAYVLDRLIDWSDIPNDPIYQLTFPQAGMLEPDDFSILSDLVIRGEDERLMRTARKVQLRMNPHPAGQMDLNIPAINGASLPGAQHKYRETLLFFPSQGQTCHAYCSYCFRWTQFAKLDDSRFASPALRFALGVVPGLESLANVSEPGERILARTVWVPSTH